MMLEADWQSFVVDLARYSGFRVAHFRPARTASGWRTPVQADGAGFPDLVMCRGSEFIAAELKADVGKVTPAQQQWLEALKACGLTAEVWRPADQESVTERLTRRRP